VSDSRFPKHIRIMAGKVCDNDLLGDKVSLLQFKCPFGLTSHQREPRVVLQARWEWSLSLSERQGFAQARDRHSP